MDAAMIQVHAKEVVARPLAEVRAALADVDHQIRRRVHPRVVMSWDNGVVQIAQRSLGRLETDRCTFVPAGDKLTITYVDGPNIGTNLEQTCLRIDDSHTEIRAVARLPATFVRRLAGPLHQIAAEHSLRRMLREARVDLEEEGYRGGPAGNVEGVLAALMPLRARIAAVPSLEKCVRRVICLVAAADGEVDQTERELLASLWSHLEASPMSLRSVSVGAASPHNSTSLVEMLAEAKEAAQSDDLAGYATSLGRTLHESDALEEALIAASLVALVTKGLAHAEFALLERLALGGELPAERLSSLIDAVDRTLTS